MTNEDYLLVIDQMQLYGITDRQQMKQCLRLLHKLPRGIMQFLVILQNCHSLAKKFPDEGGCGEILLKALQRHGHVKDLKPEKFASFNPKKFDDSVDNFPGLAEQTDEKEERQVFSDEDFADFREKKHEINSINFPGLS